LGQLQLDRVAPSVGGGERETAHNTVVAPSSAVFTQSLSTDLELVAGDYVEVLALQDSGSDNAISTRSFTMSWVAPG